MYTVLYGFGLTADEETVREASTFKERKKFNTIIKKKKNYMLIFNLKNNDCLKTISFFSSLIRKFLKNTYFNKVHKFPANILLNKRQLYNLKKCTLSYFFFLF